MEGLASLHAIRQAGEILAVVMVMQREVYGLKRPMEDRLDVSGLLSENRAGLNVSPASGNILCVLRD